MTASHGDASCDCPTCLDREHENDLVRRVEEQTAERIAKMIDRFRAAEVWEAKASLEMAAQAVRDGDWRDER